MQNNFHNTTIKTFGNIINF